MTPLEWMLYGVALLCVLGVIVGIATDPRFFQKWKRKG